jgi:AraC-like DNA-binding protein
MHSADPNKTKAGNRLTLDFSVYGGVELQHGRNHTHHFTPHFHQEYQILVVIDGDLRLRVEDAEYAVAPPAICAINPHQVHAGRSSGWGWECRNFYVPCAVAGSLSGSVPRFSEPAIEDPALAQALIVAHEGASARGTNPLAANGLVEALGALFRAYAVTASPPEPVSRETVDRTEAFLREHFAEDVRLEALATVAELSPFHFLRMFARQTGLTPHAYQTQLRLAHAKRRLAEGASAARAAAEAGFYDQSHLIRALRRSHGLTPTMIARAGDRNFVQ